MCVCFCAGVRLSYGTAGFRADAALLESTVYRVGILAALRSLKTEGSVIGMMLTASHNRVSDNGVKIADPSGEMLSQGWEPFADALANAPTSQHLLQVFLFPTLSSLCICIYVNVLMYVCSANLFVMKDFALFGTKRMLILAGKGDMILFCYKYFWLNGSNIF